MTVTSLVLFAFLGPGIVFRLIIYNGVPVKRPFASSNTIYISISIVVISACVHLINLLLWSGVGLLSGIVPGLGDTPKLIEFASSYYIFHDNHRHSLTGFLLEHTMWLYTYLMALASITYTSAKLFGFMASRYRSVGNLIYGPITALIDRRNRQFFECYVVTKTCHEGGLVVYMGNPAEIGLKDGSNIDHIVIRNPQKFFMDLTRDVPITNADAMRPVGSTKSAPGLLYLSGNDIDDVHFQSYSFIEPAT